MNLQKSVDIGTNIVDVDSNMSRDEQALLLRNLMNLFDDMIDIIEDLKSQRDSS